MIFSRMFYLSTTFCLLFTSVAYASPQQELGGFMLGGSFEAAQKHALEQEWNLVPFSNSLPGSWHVEEENLFLVVCKGMVASISEVIEGDFEEFSALVFSMQIEFGKPDTQILSLRSGAGVISTIDARFETDIGGATVQLQSIDGKRTLSVMRWIDIECN